jgi:hypothetical protein
MQHLVDPASYPEDPHGEDALARDVLKSAVGRCPMHAILNELLDAWEEPVFLPNPPDAAA